MSVALLISSCDNQKCLERLSQMTPGGARSPLGKNHCWRVCSSSYLAHKVLPASYLTFSVRFSLNTAPWLCEAKWKLFQVLDHGLFTFAPSNSELGVSVVFLPLALIHFIITASIEFWSMFPFQHLPIACKPLRAGTLSPVFTSVWSSWHNVS